MKYRHLLSIIILAFSFNIAAGAGNDILDLTPYLSTNGVSAGSIFYGAVEIEFKNDWHANSHQPLDEFLIPSELRFPENSDIKILDIVYPEPIVKTLSLTDTKTSLFGEKTTIYFSGKIDKKTAKNITLNGSFYYQACNDATCLAPTEVPFTLTLPLLNAEEVKTNPETAEIFASLAIEEQPEAKDAAGITGLLKFLLMAFIGGIILNIMPCVLPVLSIKAMSIVKQSQQDSRMIFKSSMAYTAGILVSFIVLALVIVILKLSGEMVGWGFQFQSPGFVMFLLAVIFIFALSLFDVFIINAPGMTTVTKLSSKSGLTGSFMSGVFAVLLATPCTAPILGAALGFAFSQPPLIIFLIFILVGLGLAFPFILLGIRPGAIKLIPKPGAWMNTFKEVMGFLLFGTAIFLLRSLYFLIGGDSIILVIWYLMLLAFAAWIYGRFGSPDRSVKTQWIAIILALVLSIGGAFWLLDFNTAQATEMAGSREGWQTFSPEKVEQLRQKNKPVFIDFSAEWCLTCKTNETTVLFTDEIQQAFSDYKVELLRGDNTRKDEVIGQWLQKFGRAGVPLYVFYVPGKDEPVVLPEIITKNMILEMLSENLNK